MKWQPNSTTPIIGEFLIGVWEGDWRRPQQRFRVFEAVGFPNGPVFANNYRVEEGAAFEIVGWMPKPDPPIIAVANGRTMRNAIAIASKSKT